jgi:hypothetical protein
MTEKTSAWTRDRNTFDGVIAKRWRDLGEKIQTVFEYDLEEAAFKRMDDHFNPRIQIHEADDPLVTIALMSTDSGFACFNYVYGKEKKIVTQFCSNTSSSTIANYVVDCLTPSTMYNLRTNIGTTMETVDASTMQLRIEHILGYIRAIYRASTPP